MVEDSKGAAIAKEVKAETTVEDVKAEAIAEETKAEAIAKDVKGKATAESAPTVRQIFSLPEKGTDPSDDRWKAFQDTVSKEVKGIKWTAAMPDLAPKICELLEIKIPDILISAWKKVKDLQAVLERSKKTPEEIVYLELAEHTINSEHKPSIDVKIRSATVKKLELVIQLGFKLKSFVLKIQNGGIREMQTGHCEAKGTIKYGSLTIAEKKLEPIKLPLSIPIKGSISVLGTESESQPPAPVPNSEEAPKETPKTQVPVERFEL